MKKFFLGFLILWFTNPAFAGCEDWMITDKRANFFRDSTPEIIKDCIDSGSDPNYRDEFGQTPLHMLGWVDNADLVDVLVEFGADIDRQDNEGWTPLHVAARYGYNSSVIEELIELGADHTIQDYSGKLPWHYAQINRENLEGTAGWRQLQQPKREAGTIHGRSDIARLETAFAEAARLRRELALARSRLAEAREELQLRRGIAVRSETGVADSVDRTLYEAAETRVMQLAVENTRLRDRLADLGAGERNSRGILKLGHFRSEFVREALADRQLVRTEDDRFYLPAEMLFLSGSADLDRRGRERVRRIGRALTDVAGRIPEDLDWVLRVDGHTDRQRLRDRSRYKTNWELSVARAIAVVKLLVEAGVPAERLAATGFGEFHPLDPADTREAYRRNRRIEFSLTRK